MTSSPSVALAAGALVPKITQPISNGDTAHPQEVSQPEPPASPATPPTNVVSCSHPGLLFCLRTLALGVLSVAQKPSHLSFRDLLVQCDLHPYVVSHHFLSCHLIAFVAAPLSDIVSHPGL